MLLKLACLITIAALPQTLLAEQQTPDLTVFDLHNKSDQQKLSYILGLEMFEERTRQGFVLNLTWWPKQFGTNKQVCLQICQQPNTSHCDNEARNDC